MTKNYKKNNRRKGINGVKRLWCIRDKKVGRTI